MLTYPLLRSAWAFSCSAVPCTGGAKEVCEVCVNERQAMDMTAILWESPDMQAVHPFPCRAEKSVQGSVTCCFSSLAAHLYLLM